MKPFCGVTPCVSCPWRKEIRVEAREMFPKERYVAMQACVQQGLGKPIFACHKSKEEAPLACVGYLLVEGDINFSVRIAVMTGRLDFSKLFCKGELHGSYEEMARANGVELKEIDR